jgi:hypothetical protein
MEKEPFKDQELLRVRGMLFKAAKGHNDNWVLIAMPQNAIPRK